MTFDACDAKMIGSLTCALLAPALAAAAVQSWALPEATLVVPEADRWTPAPTLAPDNDFLELFRRDDDNTCGYVSGISCMNDPVRFLKWGQAQLT